MNHRMALQLSLFDRESRHTEVLIFESSPVRIGRHAIASVMLCKADISLMHAALRFDGHKIFLHDLRSTNGTLLDGVAVSPDRPVVVPPTSTITIGDTEIRATLVESPRRDLTETIAFEQGPELVHEAVSRLRPAYQAVRRQIALELQQTLETLPLESHGMAEAIFEREFPSLGERYPFAEEKMLERLCGEVPRDRIEEADALRRLESVLRTLATSICELYQAQVRLADQLGVKPWKQIRALHFAVAEGPDRLLSYLLTRDVTEGKVLQELRDLFADMKRHPISLLRGAESGVREILLRLSPREVEMRAKSGRFTMRPQWRAFSEAHQELSERDGYRRVLLGASFMNAYEDEDASGRKAETA